jgi:hypothetical protein
MLLLQGVVIVRSLGLGTSLDLSAIARALAVLMAVMALLAVNQMPKLPWFERRFAPGGELGPIYGPRYTRGISRMVVVVMLAVIAYNVAAPLTLGWRPAPYILLASALLVAWSIAWRVRLGRKWKLEQSTAQGSRP